MSKVDQSKPNTASAKMISALERELRGIRRNITGIYELGKAAAADDDSFTNFEAHYESVAEAWRQFQQVWKELDAVEYELDPDSAFPDDKWQSIYDGARRADGILRKLKLARIKQAPSAIAQNSGNCHEHQSRTLPRISIPKFSGELFQWTHFRDTFVSLVHDTKIPQVDKMHYLRDALVGEPASILAGLAYDAASYERAWEALKREYDNPRVLATRHVVKILDFKVRASDSEYSKYNSYVSQVGESVEAFKALKIRAADDVLLSILALRALDATTRKQFELAHQGTDFPSSSDVVKFVRQRMMACKLSFEIQSNNAGDEDTPRWQRSRLSSKCVIKPSSSSTILHVSSASTSSPSRTKSGPASPSSTPNRRGRRSPTTYSNQYSSRRSGHRSSQEGRQKTRTMLPCAYCTKQHHLSRFFTFSELPSRDRTAFLKSWTGCTNCLGTGHDVSECPSKWGCRYCGDKHHSLLHTSEPIAGDDCQANSDDASGAFVGHVDGSTPAGQSLKSDALMITAQVHVEGRLGILPARVLVDCGSRFTFITSQLASKLGKRLQPYDGRITAFGGIPVNDVQGWVTLIIKSTNEDYQFKVAALVSDRITTTTPGHSLPEHVVSRLSQHSLADPSFSVPGTIDILLGIDLFPRLITGVPIETEFKGIFLMSTVFGQVVMGPVPSTLQSAGFALLAQDENDILQQLRAFWELEEPTPADRRNPSDVACEALFADTHSRNDKGSYVVRLPFKPGVTSPRNNRNVALRRFCSLERKLSRDTTLRTKYIEFMSEYKKLGHMTLATSESPYVIPHHGILQVKPNATKLRVVFDGSCSSGSSSLNDTLLPGQKLQADLPNVLTQFRLYPVAITTDIVKMYRQILVHPDDRHAQHIFWRDDPSKPLEEYELCTVTYGVRSSSHHALRVIKQLVEDEGRDFPRAAACVPVSSFVDDIVTSANSLAETRLLKEQLKGLFGRGGFELSKWASNFPELVSSETDSSEVQDLPQDSEPFIKILGLSWMPQNDQFCFSVEEPFQSATKRSLLSAIARIFDPLGFLAPVILYAKTLLQEVWRHDVTWDEPLPPSLQTKWSSLVSEWSALSTIRIPRYIQAHQSAVQLVGFSDASIKGYAASVYARVTTMTGNTSTYLLKAKTKVAPTHYRSIAQLELCGALLLQRVMSSIELTVTLRRMYFTDSSVVLTWLRTPTHQLKIFEANRISAILKESSPDQWFFVRSEENPADLASRGALPSELIGNNLWWNGPLWLSNNPLAPLISHPCRLNSSEEAQVLIAAAELPTKSHPKVDIHWMNNFSSLHVLVRSVARILRWSRTRTTEIKELHGPISSSEYENALLACIRALQRAELPSALYSNAIPKAFQQLQPFVDELGLIRVGGRLKNADMSFSRKHPLLLPRDHHFSRLIVENIHRNNFHAGPTLILSLLRSRFWIPSALRLIKSLIFKCTQCRIFRARPAVPVMGDLPPERLSQERAFKEVGVDYAGPFTIKESQRRKAALGKAYLCIFVCMATKAIHLELVSSLTTPAFLQTLDRFVSRRGLPSTIHSDNGTTFVGVSRVIKDLYRFIHSNSELWTTHLATSGINWSYIPPRSPHFGGLWEAGVKSVKSLLVNSIGKLPFTFEELATVLTRIEGLLNTRPLCPLREDPEHFDFLTPGHFLTGASLAAIPHDAEFSPRMGHVARWHIMQEQTAYLWSRWNRDYLHLLQQRTKWTVNHPNLAVGDLVIMIDSRTLPGTWPVARIHEVFPGRDGKVRVVSVRTPSGKIYKRAIATLAPLLDKESCTS